MRISGKRKDNVSKTIFLKTVKCQFLGWAFRSGFTSLQPTLSAKFLFEQGSEIGCRARELYSGGILVNEVDLEAAAEHTKSLINDISVTTIFEATFLIDSYATKVDILERGLGGWHMYEVKSGLNQQPEHIDDMAYTAMVLDNLGIKIQSMSLMLLSKDYRLGMDSSELFVEVDCTTEVEQQVKLFKPLQDEIKEITGNENAPKQELKLECRKCKIFDECLGKGIKDHIFELPRLSQKKLDMLKSVGIDSVVEIPDGFDLTDIQARVRDCVKSGTPLIGDNLEKELSVIVWPAYYLDFETVMTALPLYPDIAPHTQITTQYSIHKCSSPGKVVEHFDYLADPSVDSRRMLAERLIEDLEKSGSIIAYSSFEKTRIKELAITFPDLASELNLLLDRLVDIEKIIRNNFNHPGFHGSTSIKKTLPALVPEVTYEGMEISDGLTAVVYFAYLAQGKYEEKEAAKIKDYLLEYCKQDTYGMVKLHEYLVQHV